MVNQNKVTGPSAILGGFLWMLIPFLDKPSQIHGRLGIEVSQLMFRINDVFPDYHRFIGVIPILLLCGTYGLYTEFNRDEERLGKYGFGALSTGFIFLVIGSLIYGLFTPGSIVLLFFYYIPGILGLICVAIGSAITSYSLESQNELPTTIAVLFGLSIFFDIFFVILVTSYLGGGLSLYGFSWVVLGIYLLGRPDPQNTLRNTHTS